MSIEELRKAVEESRSKYDAEASLVKEYSEKVISGVKERYQRQFEIIDKFIQEVKTNKIKEYPTSALETQSINLSIIIYELGEAFDDSATRAELSEYAYQTLYDEFFHEAVGTVADKGNEARKKANIQKLANIIEKDINRRLKGCLDRALKAQEAIKKVLGNRCESKRLTAGRMG